MEKDVVIGQCGYAQSIVDITEKMKFVGIAAIIVFIVMLLDVTGIGPEIFSDPDVSFTIMLIAGVVLVISIFMIVLYLYFRDAAIVVKDTQISGYAAFGKRVDLPVDMISAVGTGWFKSIVVATASGKVSFMGLNNQGEIYRAISKLLMERQNKPVAQSTKSSSSAEKESNSLDDLKKLKELLDAGIITQEEFDSKKKQILSL